MYNKSTLNISLLNRALTLVSKIDIEAACGVGRADPRPE